MIGAALCTLGFATAFVTTRRRLAGGVITVVAIGYFYGIVRARFLDGASHFIFDCALLGLYAAHFSRRASADERHRSSQALPWVKALLIIPFVMFLLPLQHPLIQLVGLRAAVIFLPMVILGARLRPEDILALGRSIVVLNLVAFAFAAGEWAFGIEPFFPRNAVTEIIYRSADVGAEGAHRIPATFVNAHAYGGTMVASLPLVLLACMRQARPLRDRVLAFAALAAALLGMFASGARTPVLLLLVIAAAAFLHPRVSARVRVAMMVVGIALGAAIVRSDRLQRFTTVSDLSVVGSRIRGSNLELADVVLSYPLGAGLGRAVGTSIPFFLAHLAEPQIGLENEYSRIIVDQGLLGAAMWIAFVAWTLRRRVPLPGPEWSLPFRLMRWYVALAWLTGLTGTGVLLSVPQSPLLLVQMGMLSFAATPYSTTSPELAWRRHWGHAA